MICNPRKFSKPILKGTKSSTNMVLVR